MFDVDFYRLENGEAPVEIFLDSLNIKMRNKALDSLLLLEEFGNTLREPHSKHIESGIFELRIKFASDISRIFYFFYVGNKIILTNGFIKKTSKTPKSELNLAKKYKADYEKRFGAKEAK
ncbi:type II toxin-antitoxin system RelE/ParE family toxin [Phascolarctobacterium sp.]|uniref:type II toxin-antitoxin system RelE/ParE family toxin n=1 Tax=Phascolarctobacterium sp. TaxID=2049039 RepID=UPI0034C664D8